MTIILSQHDVILAQVYRRYHPIDFQVSPRDQSSSVFSIKGKSQGRQIPLLSLFLSCKTAPEGVRNWYLDFTVYCSFDTSLSAAVYVVIYSTSAGSGMIEVFFICFYLQYVNCNWTVSICSITCQILNAEHQNLWWMKAQTNGCINTRPCKLWLSLQPAKLILVKDRNYPFTSHKNDHQNRFDEGRAGS